MFKALWRGWQVVARKIGYVQSQIVLTLVYFVVIAPFALAVRLCSDPLQLRGASSWHWLPQTRQAPVDLDALRQQF